MNKMAQDSSTLSLMVQAASGVSSGDWALGAMSVWGAQVRPGGPWDHKPILTQMLGLEKANDYYFPIRGDTEHEYYYDIWSNIHYGYVGSAAGFDPDTLQWGAALGDGIAGFNDLGDVLSVQIGIDLWNQYGLRLTPEQLRQAILALTGDYLQLQGHKKVISGENRQ